MKRRMSWILLAVLLVGIAIAVANKHFVTDQIMDGGGTENPKHIQALDGDYTYVDNSLIWPVLEGAWRNRDGRWRMVIGESDGLSLARNGMVVLERALDFTYLQPGEVTQTELVPEDGTLRTGGRSLDSSNTFLIRLRQKAPTVCSLWSWI